MAPTRQLWYLHSGLCRRGKRLSCAEIMTCLTIDVIGSGSSTAIAEYDLAQLGIIVKEAAGPDALDNPEGPEPLMDVGKCQNSCWRPGPLPLSLWQFQIALARKDARHVASFACFWLYGFFKLKI